MTEYFSVEEVRDELSRLGHDLPEWQLATITAELQELATAELRRSLSARSPQQTPMRSDETKTPLSKSPLRDTYSHQENCRSGQSVAGPAPRQAWAVERPQSAQSAQSAREAPRRGYAVSPAEQPSSRPSYVPPRSSYAPSPRWITPQKEVEDEHAREPPLSGGSSASSSQRRRTTMSVFSPEWQSRQEEAPALPTGRDATQREEEARKRRLTQERSIVEEDEEEERRVFPFYRRSDPVQRYQQYREEWARRPPPQDCPRKSVRWNIRGRMLDDSEVEFHPTLYRPKQTAKRRDGLMWGPQHR